MTPCRCTVTPQIEPVRWRALGSLKIPLGAFSEAAADLTRDEPMHYFYLLVAVALEVSGTMLLPVSQNFTRPLPTIGLIACYASSFYCLTFALKTLPIAVVYATWSGLGIFLITLFGYLVFDEALDWRAILGLLLIVVGVVLVNGYASQK